MVRESDVEKFRNRMLRTGFGNPPSVSPSIDYESRLDFFYEFKEIVEETARYFCGKNVFTVEVMTAHSYIRVVDIYQAMSEERGVERISTISVNTKYPLSTLRGKEYAGVSMLSVFEELEDQLKGWTFNQFTTILTWLGRQLSSHGLGKFQYGDNGDGLLIIHGSDRVMEDLGHFLAELGGGRYFQRIHLKGETLLTAAKDLIQTVASQGPPVKSLDKLKALSDFLEQEKEKASEKLGDEILNAL